MRKRRTVVSAVLAGLVVIGVADLAMAKNGRGKPSGGLTLKQMQKVADQVGWPSPVNALRKATAGMSIAQLRSRFDEAVARVKGRDDEFPGGPGHDRVLPIDDEFMQTLGEVLAERVHAARIERVV